MKRTTTKIEAKIFTNKNIKKENKKENKFKNDKTFTIIINM